MMEEPFLPTSCRCCLTENTNIIYIFDTLDEFDTTISELLASYGGIQIVEADSFSKQICIECLNDLVTAARFREKCKKSEEALQIMEVELLRKEEEVSDVKMDEHHESVDDENEDYYEDDFANVTLDVIKEEVQLDDVIEMVSNESVNDDFEEVEYLESIEVSPPEENIEYIIADPDLNNFDLNVDSFSKLLKSESKDLSFNIIDILDSGLEFESNEKENRLTDLRFIKTKPLQLNYNCSFCGAGFTHLKNLKRHVTTHQVLFACHMCTKTFTNEDEFKEHNLIHGTEDVIETVDSTVPEEHTDILEKEFVNNQRKSNPKKTHICSYCHMGLVSNSALTAHIRVHTGERPYPCKMCPKRFATVGGLELHERRHTGVKPFKCDVCGRGFTESSNLKVHRRIHTGEKPHICTLCGRAFSRVFLLQIHQRTHTGEKPYACDECSRSFAQQGDLTAHKRTHTGERPHTCDICGKGFIKSSGLTQHKRKHDKMGVGCDSSPSFNLLDEVGQIINIENYAIEMVGSEDQSGEDKDMLADDE